MEQTFQQVLSAAFNADGDFNFNGLPESIQKEIKALRNPTSSGFAIVNDIVTITDATKAKAFIEKSFKMKSPSFDDDDFKRKASIWLKSDKTISAADRGEDVGMKVHDVVVRKSRANRDVVHGIGLRGVSPDGTGLKITLNQNYVNRIMGKDKNATPDESDIIAFAKKTFLDKWIVLGTSISRKGETGYTRAFTDLNPSELEEFNKYKKEDIYRDSNGWFGFIFQEDGIRYNFAGSAGVEESENYQELYDAVKLAKQNRVKAAEEGKGQQEGLAFAMQAKLAQLASMLENKLITKTEYVTMRTNLLANGM